MSVPFIIAKSRGYVLARALLFVLWLSYVGFIARVAYLFFTGD
jgi:hypothetical protein